MRKKILSFISFIISVALIVSLLSFVDIRIMLSTLMSVSLPFYVLAFAVYIGSYLARALRLSVLLGLKNSFNFFLIICGHMLFNHLLPFRTGEFSLPYLLKKTILMPYSKSMPILILLRLFDLMAIVFSFLLLVIVVSAEVSISIIMLFIAVMVLNIFTVLHLKSILFWLIKFFTLLLPKKLSFKLNDIQSSVNDALSVNNGQMIKVSILSLIDRVFGYAMSIILIIGMSYKIPVLQLIIANAVASITNIIPVNSIGSFGTLEAGWAGALMLYGVSKDVAVSSGFNFHILVLSFTILLGLISLFILNMRFHLNPFKLKTNMKSDRNR